MPKSIKSPKQFRFLEAAAHGGLKNSAGPSKDVASKMLSEELPSHKKKLAKGLRPGK